MLSDIMIKCKDDKFSNIAVLDIVLHQGGNVEFLNARIKSQRLPLL